MQYSPHPQMLFGLSVINEISTATQLLAAGLNQIVHPDWPSDEPAAAFTCLASGVERVMKLTYGLDMLHRDAAFPSTKELRDLGHDLVTLNRKVLPILEAGAASLGKDYVARLLREVSADPYWPDIVATLDAWSAASGRYRDLDILAGRTTGEDPPHALWCEVELRCIQDLGLLGELTGPRNREARVQTCTRLAESVLRWWFAFYRAWTHDLIGHDQQSPGTSLSPTRTRQLAQPLKDLTRGW